MPRKRKHKSAKPDDFMWLQELILKALQGDNFRRAVLSTGGGKSRRVF
jgi:hypothetical protein